MAEQVVPYALTTKTRVKDRLAITVADHDTLLDRLISAATDFIEAETGRRFKETTYSGATAEVHSLPGNFQDYLLLKNAPVSSITLIEYRAGTPATPGWTELTTDEYLLLEDGKSGIVRLYTRFPAGTNILRVSYTAGYKIDFANAGTATHTLPFDLSDLAERLVVRWFKRRELAGKASEAIGGSTITWKDLLDAEDIATINRYRRLPQFV